MITILVTCKQCGLKNAPVQVPARAGTHIDVAQWMRHVVTPILGDFHNQTSPKCKATILDEVKIPAPKEAEFIGQQIE